jgi:hypothetical protein
MAGESAREQARRQREKAARLVESADRWERGANGEVAVASALAELEADGWTLLHDLAWPGRNYANIDHLAIGDGRVFVVDAKNWSGDVVGAGGVLRQNGRSRTKEVAAVAEAAHAVAGLVPGLPPNVVQPVLCLVRDDWLSERFGEVLVCSSHNLVAQLRGQPRSGAALSPQQVGELIKALQSHGANAAGARVPRRSARPGRRPQQAPRKGRAFKLTGAVAMIAVILSQPTWFTSAVDRASEEFVGLFSSDASAPAPEKEAPVRDRTRMQNKKKKGGKGNASSGG